MISFDRTPGEPQPFAYKISWFAVRAADPASVLDAIELGEATPANWKSGLAAAYGREGAQDSEHWIFLSPPVSGWVLVIGISLPYPTDESHHDIGKKFALLFGRLTRRFDDVQFFGSYRVVDFVAWARALKGKPVRIFAYADGEVLANFGEQTAEEAKLGFANLGDLSPSDATDKFHRLAEEHNLERRRLVASGLSPNEVSMRLRHDGGSGFPDESNVVELAALWSVDPRLLSDDGYSPSLGLAARLPENLRQ